MLTLRTDFCNGPALPFCEMLDEERIEEALREAGVSWRKRVWTPCVTLWTFLWQVLSPDHSCGDAVARMLAFRVERGLAPCSSRTGHYCEARGKLPEGVLRNLVRTTGRDLSARVPEEWLVAGRPVKTVDGSSVSMPDTPENAGFFGKPSNQQPAVVFPVARMVAVLCLATGAALELAVGPYRGKRSGELSLFRSLPEDAFDPGDIVLADRLYCSWFDIARLRQRGVDGVFRLHSRRKADFRRGEKLGPCEHVVSWPKPARRPDWLSKEEYDALPAAIEVRELRVEVRRPGFRVQQMVLATTLTDAEEFPRAAIASLYRQRWQAEVDLRSIKTTMQMDVLRCQTPAMVRRELWTHLLAYNLLRGVTAAAALEHGLTLRDLSFKSTLQLVNAFSHTLIHAEPTDLPVLVAVLLRAIAEHRVGNRPDRCEPRARKRPAKPYPRLKQPRPVARNLCCPTGS